MDIRYKNVPVLISGNGRLSFSISVSLLQAGHSVILVTKDIEAASKGINKHLRDLSGTGLKKCQCDQLVIANDFAYALSPQIAIAITDEDAEKKKVAIRQLEDYIPADAIIAVNTESIPLNILQQGCNDCERLFGLNWVEPAHTTFFLEIIVNQQTNKELTEDIFRLAKTCWNKDPYLVGSGVSIRAKMFSAMAREAFFLVQNGHASIEDIDRACRNDAGYYLPFSGNFRYMDLMGTYAYGLVMSDLNPDLSKESCIPDFFKEIIKQGGLGMENEKGFYSYEQENARYWEKRFSKFSYQIQEIIQKYPFNYLAPAVADNKTSQ